MFLSFSLRALGRRRGVDKETIEFSGFTTTEEGAHEENGRKAEAPRRSLVARLRFASCRQREGGKKLEKTKGNRAEGLHRLHAACVCECVRMYVHAQVCACVAAAVIINRKRKARDETRRPAATLISSHSLHTPVNAHTNDVRRRNFVAFSPLFLFTQQIE